MLSEQELDTLYGEVNRPYSPKELTAHLADREVKSALEVTHAHNLELIAQVQGWVDFIGGKRPKPENKLWRLLMPGTNEENPACLRLETITEYFARYGHGDTPRMPIVVIASRSTVTLIERIRSGDDWPPKPASAADVKNAADSAAQKIVQAIESGTAKVAKAVRKKPGKKPRFSPEIQEAAQSIWERDKKNPVIKATKNHRIGHEDSFRHSKSDYIALGIPDVKTLDKVLGAKSDRTGRSNKRRIGRR